MRYILVAVLIMALFVSLAPIATAAQQQAAQKPKGSEPYFWDPFATWLVNTANWAVTGKYQPDYEEQLPGTRSVKRLDPYNYGYNPWFW